MGYNRFSLFLLFALFGCSEPVPVWESNLDKLFTKVPHQYSNIRFSNDLVETEDNNHIVNDEFITGAGVAVGDINNDGLLDLFFTGNQVRDRLYLNKGNFQFEDITKDAGIIDDKLWSTGVSFADVNNDGFLDIYVCKNVLLDNEASKNKLYINNGDLTFSENAARFNVADKGFSIQSTFFDFDKDGNLDFYLVNQPPSIGNRNGGKISPSRHINRVTTDKLYKKFNDGRFHDAGPYAETHNFAYGLAGIAGDLNNDGWTDLYVANDFDQPDHFYINTKDGKYKDMVNSAMKHISNFSMGVDIADYDNDNLLDIIVLDMVAEDHERIKTYMGGMNPAAFWETVNKGNHYQYMFNTLQRNNGNGTFAELAHLAGVSNTDWSWSPLFADLDNDGLKDLFITNGVKRNMRHSDLVQQQKDILDSIELIAKKENKELSDYIDLMYFVEMAPIDKLPNHVYKNNGDLTFSKKIEEWGFEELTLSNGAAYGDLDNDGDLDLVINNIDSKAGVYRNNTIEKNLGNYLRLQLKAKNFAHIPGTKIRIYKGDKFWQLVEITGARGYMSQSEYAAHFGLGDEIEVDRVEVEWPDGQYSILTDVKANQTLEVDKSVSYGIAPVRHEKQKRMFSEVTRKANLTLFHKENAFDDYERQVLLPHKMSEFGPVLAVGDVNGDGLDDVFVGGASGVAGTLLLQNRDGAFDEKPISVFHDDRQSEDSGATFFDSDGDGDLDLYVASG
ncbi:MAG: FG-GAP-like repeat-containing protein [Cyclobacteriaceae bacterium]